MSVPINPRVEPIMLFICGWHHQYICFFCESCNVPACPKCIENQHSTHPMKYIIEQTPQNNVYSVGPSTQIPPVSELVIFGLCTGHNEINYFICQCCKAYVCHVCIENDHSGHAIDFIKQQAPVIINSSDGASAQVPAVSEMIKFSVCPSHKEINFFLCKRCNVYICQLCLEGDHRGHTIHYLMDAAPKINDGFEEPTVQVTKDPGMLGLGLCSVHRQLNDFLCEWCIVPVCGECIKIVHRGHPLFALFDQASHTSYGSNRSPLQIAGLPGIKIDICAAHDQFHYYVCMWCKVHVCMICLKTTHINHQYSYTKEFITMAENINVNRRGGASATMQAQAMGGHFVENCFDHDVVTRFIVINNARRYAVMLQIRQKELIQWITNNYKIGGEAYQKKVVKFLTAHKELLNLSDELLKVYTTLIPSQPVVEQGAGQALNQDEASCLVPLHNSGAVGFTPPNSGFENLLIKFEGLAVGSNPTVTQNVGPTHRPILESNSIILARQPGPMLFNFPLNAVKPWGICCDKSGNIIVSYRFADTIAIFNPFGVLLRQFGRSGREPGQFCMPTGVTVNAQGHIVVVDKDNHRIQIFDENGTFLFTFGKFGKKCGQLKFPWDVACNSYGNIVVSDSGNRRIQLFNGAGVFLAKYLLTPHLGFFEFVTLRGICFTPEGSLVVVDAEQCRLIVVDPSFSVAYSIGQRGTQTGQFMKPQGVICDDHGNIIVTDSHNNRIQVFDCTGKFLWHIASTSMNFSVVRPTGVCLNPVGQIVAINGYDFVGVHVY